MTRWLILVVLAAPLAIFPGQDLAETKNLMLLALGAGSVLCFIGNPWLRAFGAWTLVVTALAGAPPWAVRGAGGVLAWLVLYQLAAQLAEPAWRKVRLAIVASALIQMLWVGLQALALDPLFTTIQPGTPLHGWFGNPMDLALYLGLSLPLVVAVHPLLAVPVATVMMWGLPTTVGTLAIAVTVLWWLAPWLRSWSHRTVAVGLVGLLALGYLARFDSQGIASRPVAWRVAGTLIAERPFMGWGPNAVDHRVVLNTPTLALRWNFLFNEWLQGWVELGALAPALALGYLVALLRRVRGRLVATAELLPALVILLVATTFSIPLRIGPVALLGALVLGQMQRRLA